MIRTILVPASGTDTDQSVFATALAIARPLGAHLHVYHVDISACEAALHAPHVDFTDGEALRSALEHLREQGETLAARARENFDRFCADQDIRIRNAPEGAGRVSAHWSEETDAAAQRLAFHTRHSDLVVLGRSRHTDYLPRLLIDNLLVGTGRPVVIAPATPPAHLTGTIVIGWKETPEAARALASAMPLLEAAQRVVLVSVVEPGSASTAALEDLAGALAWHGIQADIRLSDDAALPTTEQLRTVAIELGADLLVTGGYGHAQLRELIFGGITETLVRTAELPVLMQH
jgi:nucleotide-binding universal stress UspA family protein